MKLRNKKTREILRVEFLNNWQTDDGTEIGFRECNTNIVYSYNSLAELNKEWEDYEDPKEYWYVTEQAAVVKMMNNPEDIPNFVERCLSIGNLFGSKEEAEKAVEKLKAWKRLKDKGVRFVGYFDSSVDIGRIYAEFPKEKPSGEVHKDLDLLFGGKE